MLHVDVLQFWCSLVVFKTWTRQGVAGPSASTGLYISCRAERQSACNTYDYHVIIAIIFQQVHQLVPHVLACMHSFIHSSSKSCGKDETSFFDVAVHDAVSCVPVLQRVKPHADAVKQPSRCLALQSLQPWADSHLRMPLQVSDTS